ncbi:MAG: c-type cytochrome [Thermocrinis sp.]|jgi:cytochrome c|nr:c-type cytochrome [Thermocrinis sp.]
MKKSLLLGLFSLGFLAVSCQQKPAEQPAGEQKPTEQQQQPAQQQQQQQQQPAGEQQQPTQQPAGEQKPAEQPKSEAKPAQTTATAGAEDLAKAKGCFACHDVNAKKVGPSYKDVANKYAGKADAVNYLADKIKKGGAGVWGNVPMPPQNVTDEEAKKLAEWILSLK